MEGKTHRKATFFYKPVVTLIERIQFELTFETSSNLR